MTTFIDVSIIQSVAPANLNRDDTGAPKSAVFGGVRRARISSQCLKRAARLHFASAGLLSQAELSVRTRNLVAGLIQRIEAQGVENAAAAASNAMASLGVSSKAKKAKKGKGKKEEPIETEANEEDSFGVSQSSYLLFISNGSIDRLAQVIAENATDLAQDKVSAALEKELHGCLSVSAADLALFGRMIADAKDLNVDAAAQVAHAISTHRTDRESDFFTAVDDWAAAEEADAGMLGNVEFNSSCLYRFSSVNFNQLLSNLNGDHELALRALNAYIRAAVMAIPSGAQNTFAAHNLPAFVGVAVHSAQPVSLANAVEKPVRYTEHPDGLAAASVVRLQQHAAKLEQFYGLNLGLRVMDTTGAWVGDTAPNLDTLVEQVLESITAEQG
jgi:CRISPR system Cascade subunit CasC